MTAYAYGKEIGGVVNDTRKLTQAEYDALTDEEKNNGCIYVITDSENVRNLYGDNISDAANIVYDDSETALGADNVSGAISALNSKLSQKVNVNFSEGTSAWGDGTYLIVSGKKVTLKIGLTTSNIAAASQLFSIPTEYTPGDIFAPVVNLTDEVSSLRVYPDGKVTVNNNMALKAAGIWNGTTSWYLA